MATAAEHARKAEELLEQALERTTNHQASMKLIDAAQAYATLALALKKADE